MMRGRSVALVVVALTWSGCLVDTTWPALRSRDAAPPDARLGDSTGPPADRAIDGAGDASRPIAPAQLISSGAEQTRDPDVAAFGGDFVIVWPEKRSGRWDIYGAKAPRIAPTTAAAPLVLSVAKGDHREAVAIQGDATRLVVFWTLKETTAGAEKVMRRRFDAALTGIDIKETPFVVTTKTTPQTNAAVAAGAADVMVVWEDFRTASTSGIDIFGTPYVIANNRPSFSGGRSVALNSGPQRAPSIARTSASYVVAYTDHSSGSGDVLATRVSASGTVLDGKAGGGIKVAVELAEEREPSVAARKQQFIVAWSVIDSALMGDIRARRFTTNGTAVDSKPIEVVALPNDQRAPAVAADGTGYFVVWVDRRGGVGQIYGNYVLPNGTVQQRNGFLIGGSGAARPAVAYNNGVFMVAWREGFKVYATRYVP